MPYICKKCSNKEEFKQSVEGNWTSSGLHYIDETGEVVDEVMDSDGDINITERGLLSCCGCGSTEIEDVTENDWEEWEGPSKVVKKKKTESWRTNLRRRGVI